MSLAKPAAKAFLFDLNGTMIDDMHFHLEGWHSMLTKELGAVMTLAETRKHMYGTNHELLIRVFGESKFTREEMDTISLKKERLYQSAYLPHLKLLPGLDDFLSRAAANGVSLAIGSAAIPFNIDFVLDNLNIRNRFAAIVSGLDVQISKPDPETYLYAAKLVGVEPGSCIVFEDAPKGVEAALRAGMDAIVITTMHEQHEFNYPNIRMFVKDYNDARLVDVNPMA
jgi:HAD superfamily hydrolase (TIGR01509 family)